MKVLPITVLSILQIGLVACTTSSIGTERISAEIEETSVVVATTNRLSTEDNTIDHQTTDWLTVSGRTEDGLVVLGNPDAPITFIDYSDFM